MYRPSCKLLWMTWTSLIVVGILGLLTYPSQAQDHKDTSDENSTDYEYVYDYSDDGATDPPPPNSSQEGISKLLYSPTLAPFRNFEAVLVSRVTEEQLNALDDKVLIESANSEGFQKYLPLIKPNVLVALLRRLPKEHITSIATKNGVLEMLSDTQILVFADHFDAFNATDPTILRQIVDQRPHLVAELPIPIFEEFIGRKNFIRRLKKKTIVKLFMDHDVIKKLFGLKKVILAQFVTHNPELLSLLPENGPAKDDIQKLLLDRKQLTSSTVRLILQLYPHLPSLLSADTLRKQKRYMRDIEFLDSLPCSVFRIQAQNIDFINLLQEGDITTLARSQHLWDCLSVDDLRYLLRFTRLGENLRIADIIRAVLAMEVTKSFDPNVVFNLFRFQMPLTATKRMRSLSSYLDKYL